MKLLFIGSKGMGVLALEELVRQGADVVAVVARWDDPSPDQWYPSVTQRARELGLDVLQPENINAEEFVSTARDLAPDILLTAFYPKLLKRPLLEIAPQGSINLHFAPLPRYRGSFPGAWAIINGETRHGVTLHRMDPGVDSGDVVDREMVDISSDDTGFTLYGKCEKAGLRLVRRAWPMLAAGTGKSVLQNEENALYYSRDYPYGGVINFTWTARQVHDYVRAMTFPPYPNPFTFHRGRKLTVARCQTVEDGGSHTSAFGQIIGLGESVFVQASSGVVEVLEFCDGRGNWISTPKAAATYDFGVGDFLGR